MTHLNRTALVVRYAPPFIDWANRMDPDGPRLSAAEMNQDATVYLIEECESEADLRRILSAACTEIFEAELNSWYIAPETWPRRRDLETFDLWFDWSAHSIVIDSSRRPLRRE